MQNFSLFDVPRALKYGFLPALQTPFLSPPCRFVHQLRYHDWRFYDLKHHVLVFPEQRVVFVQIGKAACTSIKKRRFGAFGLALPQTESLEEKHRHYTIHAPGFTLSDEGYYEALTSPDYIRFAFVRHPLARLYSAYRDKIASAHNAAPNTDYRAIAQHFRLGKGAPVSFEQFVSYVCHQRPMDQNWHWAQQTKLLFLDRLNYRFIGKVEQLEDDMTQLLQLIDPSLSLREDAPVRENQNAPDHAWQSAYSPAMQQMAMAFYSDDLQRFDYQ